MPVRVYHTKSVIQRLFVSCRLIAGGFTVFSAVSRVSSFEADDDTDDSVSDGQENKDCMLCCTILVQLDPEWKQSRENHTAKLIYPNKMDCSGILQSAFNVPVHLRWGGEEGWGGVEGSGSENLVCIHHLVFASACGAYGVWRDSDSVSINFFVCWSKHGSDLV